MRIYISVHRVNNNFKYYTLDDVNDTIFTYISGIFISNNYLVVIASFKRKHEILFLFHTGLSDQRVGRPHQFFSLNRPLEEAGLCFYVAMSVCLSLCLFHDSLGNVQSSNLSLGICKITVISTKCQVLSAKWKVLSFN